MPSSWGNAEAGTYTAVAKWDRLTDFFGKGYDSNPVTFEVLTKSLAITANKRTASSRQQFHRDDHRRVEVGLPTVCQEP